MPLKPPIVNTVIAGKVTEIYKGDERVCDQSAYYFLHNGGECGHASIAHTDGSGLSGGKSRSDSTNL